MDDLLYWGTDRRIHYLRLCPLSKLPDLHRLFTLLGEEHSTAMEHHHYPTREGLIHNCEAVREVCMEILYINGIDPSHISIRQMVDFCLGNEEEAPLLAKLNGLSGEDEPVERSEVDESLQSLSAYLLGVLISAGIDYTTARQMMEDYSLGELNRILEGIVGKADDKNGIPKTEKGKRDMLADLMKDFSQMGSPQPNTPQAKAPLGKGMKIIRDSPPPAFFKK